MLSEWLQNLRRRTHPSNDFERGKPLRTRELELGDTGNRSEGQASVRPRTRSREPSIGLTVTSPSSIILHGVRLEPKCGTCAKCERCNRYSLQHLNETLAALDHQSAVVINEAAAGSVSVWPEDRSRTEGEWDNAINDIIELNEKLKEVYQHGKTQRGPHGRR